MDPEDPVILPGVSDTVRSKWTLSAFVLREGEVPVPLPARQLGAVTIVRGADLVRAFDKGAAGTDPEVILGELPRAVLEGGSFGKEDSVSFLELLPGGSATVGAVTEGELDRRSSVLLCCINQIECPRLVVAVVGEGLGRR